jgi:hypothetical protein
MYNSLKHLSEKEIEILMDKYYSGAKVTDLLNEYSINCSESVFYKLFPPKKFFEYKCEFCGEILVADRHSKTNNTGYRNYELYCPNCFHKPFTECKCSNCLLKEIEIENIRRENLFEIFDNRDESIDYNELSFLEKVYLGALIRAGMREDEYVIESKKEKMFKLVPYTKSNEFELEIYKYLVDRKIILIDPESDLESFSFNEKNYPITYDTFKVSYLINIKNLDDELLQQILNPKFYSEEYSEDAFDLWKKIALEECIEYLLYQMEKVNFSFSVGKKTNSVLKTLLEDFSVSQIFAIIYNCVSNASRYCLERNVSRKQAANSVIIRCERYGERAISQNWTINRYGRLKDLSQSSLSSYFFYKVIQIGELGFDDVPQKI